MIICSKRIAILCSLLSVWAIIMLTLMGILLYSHAVTFAEDLELHEIETSNIKEFYPEAYQRYESAAHNCWIAACLYIATLAYDCIYVVYDKLCVIQSYYHYIGND
ncbi:hypothetical protein DERP_002092 [Dermatophagoides pteronyssinus]|uniref:Uncharacterized protein n=1 Tax=Dermatophagoides pteronyssinus TaxID=6956 RepID=A0ABQ8JGR0_DERPT|nr:hypothetical protein DERP_002092 [Dermatophagoides pteronyssinus]